MRLSARHLSVGIVALCFFACGSPPTGSGGRGGTGAGARPGTGGTSGSSGSGGSAGTGAQPGRTGCLAAGSGDYSKAGPYAVATEDVNIGSSGMFTIYYPRTFEPNCPHPIAVWGNGTFVTGSAVYDFFTRNNASWGIVTAVSHNSNVGTGDFHRAAIDYLLQQNSTAGSKYNGKLSTAAGVTGHSQGCFGATRASTHANVKAEVCVGGGGSPPATVAILYLTGTLDLEASSVTGFNAATGPAFLASWEGGDHISTETLLGYLAGDPGTIQMMRFQSAWFRCFLADDQVACSMFKGGQNCGVCRDRGWAKLQSKNL
jgi:hypothetical protein